MYVFTADAEVYQVARQLFGHALGEGGHQHALAFVHGVLYLVQQVVYLAHGGPHLHDRIEQTRGTYHLLHHHALGFVQLVVGRCGADVYRLAGEVVELVVGQRPVVQRRRQAETVLHQACLAAAVAAVHGANLRHRDVALVHHQQEVVGEIVYQAERTAARRAAVEVAAVVLYTGAVAQLLYHLHVIVHPLLQALGFQVLAYAVQVVAPLIHVALYLQQRACHILFAGEEVAGGVYHHLVEPLQPLSADGVEALEALYLVVPKADAVAEVGKRGEDVHGVAFHAEAAVGELNLIAHILPFEELHEQLVASHAVAYLQGDGAALELLGVADAVDAAHRADDYDIPSAAEQGTAGSQTQLVKLVVDGQVFLYVGVGGGNVGLGLVVVVVADEVLHGVVGEELAELAVELGRQRLVVAQHQRGAPKLLYDVGYGECLAATRDALQHLRPLAAPHALHQLADGLRLVAHRRKVRFQFKIHSL